MPDAVAPAIPDALTERGRVEWDRMVPVLLRMRVLTEADGAALGLLCNAMAALEEVTEQIRQTGYLCTNPSSGAVHVNPLFAVQTELNRQVTTGLRDFGQTPAARTKVSTVKATVGPKKFDLDAAAS